MKTIKKISVWAASVLLLGIFSCEETTTPTADYTVTITGTVTRINNSPLDSVVVVLKNPFKTDTTGTDGKFEISFTSNESNTITTQLTFNRLGFFSDTVDVEYGATKKSISVGQVSLKGLTGAQDSVVTGRPSARPGVIVFLRATSQLIAIRGAGSNDATNLTFEVRDSLGVPVDETNKATVFFKLVSKPDSLTELNKTSAVTNSVGQVVVQLTAGQKSGIAQVQAYAAVKRASDTTKTDTIKSSIVSITIAGGLPVASRFTIGSQRVNVPGLVKFNLRNTITAVVGDTFGNPVQKGTVVYFRTNGGIIQPAAQTTEDGTVAVDLITGNPVPPNGIATITAEVGTTGGGSGIAEPGGVAKSKNVDEKIIIKNIRAQRQKLNSKGIAIDEVSKLRSAATTTVFTKTLNVLFSGAPRITSNDSVFVVPTLGSKQINFTVADENGNPLSQGTTIKVTGIGTDTSGAVLTGDLDKTLPDTYDRSFTQFSINVSDKRTKNLSSTVPITISIEVSGDNGNLKKTFSGVLSSGVSDSGKVGSIQIVNTATDTIVVAGAGTPNSAIITAKVLNATGQPSSNVPVSFTITRSVNGGEYLSNVISVTDANGLASTTLFSGVKAGLVQVQAIVRRDTLSIGTDPKSIYIKTGKLASLAVISISNTTLSVKGGGGDENATLVYEGRDSLGNPIDVSNQSVVTFTMVGDTNGAKISPSAVKTDPNNGRVTAAFNAGTKSGLVQIRAKSGTVESPPATIAISGGFAVDSLFSFTGLRQNYSIFETSPASIGVLVGDEFGNPVRPGTMISFTTDAGVVSPNALTDQSGRAAATLQISNSKQSVGTRFVRAKTIGKGGIEIAKSQNIILSGAPIITLQNVLNDTVKVFDGGQVDVSFKIADTLGNPISSGHIISVTLSGDVANQLVVTGDIANQIEDTQDRNKTNYSIRVKDQMTLAGTGGNFAVTISVNGVSGVTTRTFYGTLFAPNNIVVPPSARKPAQIAFISTTATDLYVAGVGSTPENALLTYEVRDSLGVPIDKNQRAVATYSMEFFPNSLWGGGTAPAVIPTVDSTDDQGKLRVSVVSGTQAGNLQVVVKIDLGGGKIIQSEPVKITIHAGFPDQNHFTILPAHYSFLGFDIYNETGFTVVVADTFSNPVAENTAIYFHSQASVIQTGTNFAAYTDRSGKASVNLLAGVNPRPVAGTPYAYTPSTGPYAALIGGRSGYFWVYAQTQGRNGKKIIDSVLVLQNVGPITVTGVPTSTVTLPRGGSTTPITITIKDGNGNPLPEETTIAPSVITVGQGTEGVEFGLSGDLTSAEPTEIGHGSQLIFPGPRTTDFTFTVSDLSLGGGAPIGTQCIVSITITTPNSIGGSTSTSLRTTVSFRCQVQ